MLLGECRLDLVSKAARQGKAVSGYLGRYAEEPDTRLALGQAEGRDLIGVFRGSDARPAYVILLDWEGDRVSLIRDYRYVPYLANELDFKRSPTSEGAAR
jgi:hypothetical protein